MKKPILKKKRKNEMEREEGGNVIFKSRRYSIVMALF
jgi:hypothetical protein